MRRLPAILSAVSLLLCLACIVMWMLSDPRYYRLEWMHGQYDRWALISGHGHVRLVDQSVQMATKVPVWWLFEEAALARGRSPQTNSRWPEYRTRTHVLPSGTLTQRELTLPYWLPTLVTAILPAVWLATCWKRNRAAQRRGFEVDVVASPQ